MSVTVPIRGVLLAAVAYGGRKLTQELLLLDNAPTQPLIWCLWSLLIWLSWFIVVKGQMEIWEKRQLLWGVASVTLFLDFLYLDPHFQGWGDVYYFCGERFQYCTCEFRWNIRGWGKALVLWSFILSTVLGLHKFVIQLGLGGLLPGEEMVTRESFISICWRLIPYWLNNWEQQWGTECSSMMFELPHFAVELLLVLPCVQIICSRLKLLALPHMRVMVPAAQLDFVQRQQELDQAAAAVADGVLQGPPAGLQHGGREVPRAHLAANILQGFWEVDASQQRSMPRLRANLRMMFVIVAVSGLAAANALYVPLHLEKQISLHPRTALMLTAAKQINATAGNETTSLASEALKFVQPLKLYRGRNLMPASERGQELWEVQQTYMARGCADPSRLLSKIGKHASEIGKMTDPEHLRLIPLVEAALALMRLSCEKFFVLVSVYVAYLLFQDPPGPVMRFMIRLNARLSHYIQKTILYCFPAICWIYGAGFIFSSFVSFVFWGGSLMRAYESVRRTTTVVRPCNLQDATEQQIERMGGHCAICWGDMGALAALGHVQQAHLPASEAEAEESPAVGRALPCGHAFHEACLIQWLHQCQGQGRATTCPMCQATIQIEVQYHVTALWSALWRGTQQEQPEGGMQQGGREDAGDALQREIQALIEDNDPVPFVADAEAIEWDQAARIPPPGQPQPQLVPRAAEAADSSSSSGLSSDDPPSETDSDSSLDEAAWAWEGGVGVSGRIGQQWDQQERGERTSGRSMCSGQQEQHGGAPGRGVHSRDHQRRVYPPSWSVSAANHGQHISSRGPGSRSAQGRQVGVRTGHGASINAGTASSPHGPSGMQQGDEQVEQAGLDNRMEALPGTRFQSLGEAEVGCRPEGGWQPDEDAGSNSARLRQSIMRRGSSGVE